MICAACHRVVSEHKGKHTAPHHIRSRAAGGSDDATNLLQLCFDCHVGWHQKGWQTFIENYPHLKERVKSAKGML
jgi:hypothetical protein